MCLIGSKFPNTYPFIHCNLSCESRVCQFPMPHVQIGIINDYVDYHSVASHTSLQIEFLKKYKSTLVAPHLRGVVQRGCCEENAPRVTPTKKTIALVLEVSSSNAEDLPKLGSNYGYVL